MTLSEKQVLAAEARTLIKRLLLCDDSEFVDLIIECISSADEYPLRTV